MVKGPNWGRKAEDKAEEQAEREPDPGRTEEEGWEIAKRKSGTRRSVVIGPGSSAASEPRTAATTTAASTLTATSTSTTGTKPKTTYAAATATATVTASTSKASSGMVTLTKGTLPSLTRRVKGGSPPPRRVQSPRRVGQLLTAEEKRQMMVEAMVITGRQQTEAGKKFCYGCAAVGHIRSDCPTNPWGTKKRTRTSHTGETPEGKVAKYTPRVFDKPEFGPDQHKLILFPTEGEVTEERHSHFKDKFDGWVFERVEEAEEQNDPSILEQIPEIDKNKRYFDRIELSVPTFRDLQKLKEVLGGVDEIGFKVLTPDEYAQAREKLTRFSGVIPVDPSKVSVKQLNMFVKIHKRTRNIEGRLEITRCWGRCQRGGVYELMASDKALERWTDHYLHLGSSGKIQFTKREKPGNLKIEADKLDSEVSRLAKELDAVKARKEKVAFDLAVAETEGELQGFELGEEGQGGSPVDAGNEVETPVVGEFMMDTEGGGEFPSLPSPSVVNMSSPGKRQPTVQADVLEGSSSAGRPSKGTLPGPQQQ